MADERSETQTSFDALKPLPDGRFWYDVPANEAKLLYQDGIPIECAPINDFGKPCPWPWDPELLDGAPLGQYHCPYCGGLAVAGVRHFDDRNQVRE